MSKDVTGLDGILKVLNEHVVKIQGGTRKGMREVGVLIKAESVRNTPVDTANLRGSAYMEVFEDESGPGVEIGYTAFYAPFVHEIDADYRAPGTGWKFLQFAIQDIAVKILEILRRNAEVK